MMLTLFRIKRILQSMEWTLKLFLRAAERDGIGVASTQSERGCIVLQSQSANALLFGSQGGSLSS